LSPPVCFDRPMVIVEQKVDGASPAELNRFVRAAQALAKIRGEVDVLITGNARVKELNRRFRRKNKPTDVLSFPRPEGGDIAISAEIAAENAQRFGHDVQDELKILILHGMLHLAGYDHESDNGRMASREARLRAQLKLPASLIERTHSPHEANGAAGKAGAPVRKSSPSHRQAHNSRSTTRRRSRT
jgi:probable rRNA maturation factor